MLSWQHEVQKIQIQKCKRRGGQQDRQLEELLKQDNFSGFILTGNSAKQVKLETRRQLVGLYLRTGRMKEKHEERENSREMVSS